MLIVRARIAVWELVEPSFVTNANNLLLSICTVSLGAKSFAAIIQGSTRSSFAQPPVNMRTIRSDISLTSILLALKYSSSILANISAKLSPVTATA